MQGAEAGWGGGRGSASRAFQNPHILQQLKGKRLREVTRPTKQFPENAPPQLYRDRHRFILLHTHSPGSQLTGKSLHSRNSKEGLASDKTQEEKFIDLFI